MLFQEALIVLEPAIVKSQRLRLDIGDNLA